MYVVLIKLQDSRASFVSITQACVYISCSRTFAHVMRGCSQGKESYVDNHVVDEIAWSSAYSVSLERYSYASHARKVVVNQLLQSRHEISLYIKEHIQARLTISE